MGPTGDESRQRGVGGGLNLQELRQATEDAVVMLGCECCGEGGWKDPQHILCPGAVFTALPTSPEVRLDSAAYRLLLLRRLRLPLPLDSAACRCGAPPRLPWRSPAPLPPRWIFALPGHAFGASSCQGLPRGRSHCCSQCFAPRPQCHRTAPR